MCTFGLGVKMTIKTIGNITDDETLWRYMSLDKLVNLLETKMLYFAPLESYRYTDPFEGYVPDVAAKTYCEVQGFFVKGLEEVFKCIESKPDINRENLDKTKSMLANYRHSTQAAYEKLAKEITVNCWHQNISESEAMWRLYSDDNKGVAIKTSVKSLISSFGEYDKTINLGKVKYIDFADRNLNLRDCKVDGHSVPLLKRSSFEHEKEVRCFIFSNAIVGGCDIKVEASPNYVPVCTETLIEQIFISPFAKEPFNSSVFAICKKYNFDEKVVQSDLLYSGSFLRKLTDW